ncbi:MAG: hypothetical protein KJS95_09875 [Gammaproteobacteria bacterium]|nr:hypothetical protein [Gammaproteobacteria bacterium]
MSKSNTFEQSLLELLFNNSNIANVGDATGLRGSSTAGSLYLALHTSDPGEAGSQTTSECTYTSYARQAVARSVAGFTISGNIASLAANVDFPEATGGSETATHFSIGTSSSGAGTVLYKGSITPTIAISSGVIPRVKSGSIVTED